MDNTTIRFPNFNFEVHPGKSIEVFGVKIAFYGIIIGLAMLAGIIIAYREAKKTGQNVEDYVDFSLWTLIMAILGARLYYVIFEWDYYSKHLLEIVTGFRDGGLAIYGGIIASILTLIIFTKIRKLSFARMIDTACLGLVVGQIIGRWGNFFNREAFGGYTNSIFAMQIPVSEANGVTKDLLLNSYIYNGEAYIQVHPTFLYEGLWNLGLFIILMAYRKHKKFEGEVFAFYLIGYGLGRAWIEGLRTDQLWIPHTQIPVSQVLSVVLVITATAFVIYKRKKISSMKEAGVMADTVKETVSDGLISEVIVETETAAKATDSEDVAEARDEEAAAKAADAKAENATITETAAVYESEAYAEDDEK